MEKSRPVADFVSEAVRLTGEAENRGVKIRMLGATAFKFHSMKSAYLFDKMSRQLSDLDFITYSKYNSKLQKFFVEMGYSPRERFIAYHGKYRHIYDDLENHRYVDVFFDKLEFNHTIKLEGRLECDSPTIPLAELLLEKMQIVRLESKDIKDTIILLREHEIGDSDNETINADHIVQILSRDWGFCYTVTRNLGKIRENLLNELLSEGDKSSINAKIEKLIRRIEQEPKSIGWKIRARVGPSQKWYNEVDDVVPRASKEREQVRE